jgi:hypothetical protein
MHHVDIFLGIHQQNTYGVVEKIVLFAKMRGKTSLGGIRKPCIYYIFS